LIEIHLDIFHFFYDKKTPYLADTNKTIRKVTSVIPVPYQVRDKLRRESGESCDSFNFFMNEPENFIAIRQNEDLK